MKKIVLSILLGCVMISLADAQARKPSLMVIPSDSYCNRIGCLKTEVGENGETMTYADYRKAFIEDENLRLVISEMSAIMSKRGFDLWNLEHELKDMPQKELEKSVTQNRKTAVALAESDLDRVMKVVRPDIIMDLDFIIKRHGPDRYIHFNLQAIDAYTKSEIASASGEGRPSSASSPGILLEEAVLNYMDNFNALLTDYFRNMLEKGRQVMVEVNVWDDSPILLDTEYEFMGETGTLSDIIDYWMSENSVEGRFSRLGGSENYIRYSPRIPIYKTVFGKSRAIGTIDFLNGLKSFLGKEPFYIESNVVERGLGEARLVIAGEKTKKRN